MKLPLIIMSLLSFFSLKINAQVSFYLSPGFTYGSSKANLERLQSSYDSYLTATRNSFPNDPFTAPENWKSKQMIPGFSFHSGVSLEDGPLLGFSYFGYRLKQERSIIRESGYGRKFVWRENRNEFLFDFGYGAKYIHGFVSFGVNSNNYKMSSYSVYPDGTESINQEYTYNGNYRVYDAGLSYGIGAKIQPIKYLAIDLRMIYATDRFPGEGDIGAEPALADNTFARTPGTEQYPQDYTKPQTLDNEIVPNFKRTYYQISFLYYFKFK